jgi:hypothetical protein
MATRTEPPPEPGVSRRTRAIRVLDEYLEQLEQEPSPPEVAGPAPQAESLAGTWPSSTCFTSHAGAGEVCDLACKTPPLRWLRLPGGRPEATQGLSDHSGRSAGEGWRS